MAQSNSKQRAQQLANHLKAALLALAEQRKEKSSQQQENT
jgi:hypothetical protein